MAANMTLKTRPLTSPSEGEEVTVRKVPCRGRGAAPGRREGIAPA